MEKEDTKEDPDKIWISFSQAVAILLPKKIFETLQVPRMQIGDRRLDMTDLEYRNNALKFRRLFSLEREATPELIWEGSMRSELRAFLSSQLDRILVRHE